MSAFDPDLVLLIAVVKPDITVLMAFSIEELGGVTAAGVDGFVGSVGLAQAVASASKQSATKRATVFHVSSREATGVVLDFSLRPPPLMCPTAACGWRGCRVPSCGLSESDE